MQTITLGRDTRVYEKGHGSFLISTGTQLSEGSKVEVIKSDFLLYKNVPRKAIAYTWTAGQYRWILCEESGILFPNQLNLKKPLYSNLF